MAVLQITDAELEARVDELIVLAHNVRKAWNIMQHEEPTATVNNSGTTEYNSTTRVANSGIRDESEALWRAALDLDQILGGASP